MIGLRGPFPPEHPRAPVLRDACSDYTTAVEVLIGKFGLTSSELSYVIHQHLHRFSQRMVEIERRASQVPE